MTYKYNVFDKRNNKIAGTTSLKKARTIAKKHKGSKIWKVVPSDRTFSGWKIDKRIKK